MTSTLTAPTIPPRVRLDAESLPAFDVLAVLARRDATRRNIPPRIDVVYSPGPRKHG